MKSQMNIQPLRAFTPEIICNLIAMAIEKFVMAVLMRHGALPYKLHDRRSG